MSATRNKAAARAANVEGGTVDLLTQAVERAAAMLADAARPTKQRIRLLWAAAKTDRSAGDDFRHVDQVAGRINRQATRKALSEKAPDRHDIRIPDEPSGLSITGVFYCVRTLVKHDGLCAFNIDAPVGAYASLTQALRDLPSADDRDERAAALAGGAHREGSA